MGTISRQAGAPIADGETSSGTEMEAEINTLFVVINGNIDNANVNATAAIAGTKLADNTVTNAKILADTILVAKMAAAAVPKHYVEIDAAPGTWTTGTSLADLTGMTGAVLTPGSTDDMILMDVAITFTSGAAGDVATIGWSVNGTDYDDQAVITVLNGRQTFVSNYAIAAPAASSMTIKPRHKRDTGTETWTINNTVFRCWILPGKV